MRNFKFFEFQVKISVAANIHIIHKIIFLYECSIYPIVGYRLKPAITGIQNLNSIWVSIEYDLEFLFDLELTLIWPRYDLDKILTLKFEILTQKFDFELGTHN